ncbi:MAG: polysaccharide biosynthesis/export family protein [Paludibacteraceae bacterium]|nr:polysaccharide biosynthesis/export family protein [Paludibacteraceae bacterium]
MKKIYQKIILISILILFTSCVSQKKIAYFYGLDEQSAETINQSFKTIHEARICPGDMLSITVSGIDPEAVAPFNLPLVSYASPGSAQIYAAPVLQSYLVDVNGYINFPIIGPIKLAGLTKSQAIQHINELLSPYLKNSIVTIQFLNYKVTVLGEVLRPGQYPIDNERVTVLDALGLAGDMTIYGKRENVLLIRENFGKLEFVRLNLNATDLFTSPYYYLQQNDILYVEPNVVRNISAQNIPLYLSTLSTIATLVTVIYSISK